MAEAFRIKPAFLRAREILALDPPTHLSPGEWRQLVAQLLQQIATDRMECLDALATKIEERAEIVRLNENADLVQLGRVEGLLESAVLARTIAREINPIRVNAMFHVEHPDGDRPSS